MYKMKKNLRSDWDLNQDNYLYEKNIRKIKSGSPKVACNVCGKKFHAVNRFERYCQDCRQDSDLLKTYF